MAVTACESCAGTLSYAPDIGRLVCDHCARQTPIARAPLANDRFYESCPTCSAEIARGRELQTHRCLFCDTLLPGMASPLRTMPEVRWILPFAMTSADVEKRLEAWFAEMPAAPARLEDKVGTDRPWQGLYVPFYLMKVEGQEHLVNACQTFSDFISGGDLLRAAWQQAPLEPFAPGYLAGFDTVLPTMGVEEVMRRHQAQLIEDQLFLEDLKGGADRARPGFTRKPASERRALLKANPPSIDEAELVLVPLWTKAYRWRGKPYLIAIDGWSGVVAGQRPMEGMTGQIMFSRFVSHPLGFAVVVALFCLYVVLSKNGWEIQ
ncbi:MAG: hypothetical protein AAGE80_03080 [Pseudomonadota bacterium]